MFPHVGGHEGHGQFVVRSLQPSCNSRVERAQNLVSKCLQLVSASLSFPLSSRQKFSSYLSFTVNSHSKTAAKYLDTKGNGL